MPNPSRAGRVTSRTWILFGFVFAMVALPLGLGVASSWRKSSSAFAILRIRQDRTPFWLAADRAGNDPSSFEVERSTQLALLQSRFVIQAALRAPGVSELLPAGAVGNPIGWVRSRIETVPDKNSAIVEVRFWGADSSSSVKILNALVEAYLSEVIEAERARVTRTLESLQQAHRDKLQEYKELTDQTLELERTYLSSESHLRLLFHELDRLERKRERLEQMAFDAELEIESRVEQLPALDPQVIPLQEGFTLAQEQLAAISQEIEAQKGRIRQIDHVASGQSELLIRREQQRQVGKIMESLTREIFAIEMSRSEPPRVEVLQTATAATKDR